MDKKIKNKSGQVTIFIIIAIMIVGAILLFLFFRSDFASKIGGGEEKSAQSFLSLCLEDKIQEAIKLLGKQGGNINPTFAKTFRFEEEATFTDISYLCYNQNYYYPCINQQPMLIQHLEEEIKDYISDDVERCFDEYTSDLQENQGYVVEVRGGGFDVELIEKKVVVTINKKITLTKSGKTSSQENFEIILPTNLYGLASVAQEIISQEARFCYFENIGYMELYPEWSIRVFRTSDSILIYTITHEKTKEWFRFAVRGCIIPSGF